MNFMHYAALGISLAMAVPASASVQTYFTADVGSFVQNSAQADFTAALSSVGTIVHLDFNTDVHGNAPIGSPVSGSIFSNDILFSSVASPTYGGSTSSSISYSGSGYSSEIGPVTLWDGIFVIDFAAKNRLARGVGFGTVSLDANERIRAYDQNNVLIGSWSDAAPIFSSWGIVAGEGTYISRIELEGDFYAIQDISYVTTPVPEPETYALIGAGLLAVGLSRRFANTRA